MALGPELVTDGNFDAYGGAWTEGDDWDYQGLAEDNAQYHDIDVGAPSTLSQSVAITSGKTYTLTFDIVTFNDLTDDITVNLAVKVGGTTVANYGDAQTGSKTITGIAGANGLIEFLATTPQEASNSVIIIDNVSLKKVISTVNGVGNIASVNGVLTANISTINQT